MAKTDFIYLQGKLKWVRSNKPDEWGNWKCTLYPTNEALEVIRELQAEGLKNVLKKDEDGYNVTFRRPTSKLIRGKVVGFEPPSVVDTAGVPLDKPIGNGSDGTVKLCVYQHGTPGGGKAKAARWEGIRVDNLVPFNPEGDYDDAQEKVVRGLKDQPEQLF